MKRIIFNREAAYSVARAYAVEEDLTDDKLNDRIEELVKEYENATMTINVSKKLIELGWSGTTIDGTAFRAAKDLTENFPKEMEQNLNEWLDDKPLTEIKYGGYSFKDMKNQHKDIELPFYYYLVYMKEFILDGKKDPGVLRIGFLRL